MHPSCRTLFASRPRILIALVTGLAFTAGVSTVLAARGDAAVPSSTSRDLAAEVCEDMVRDSAVAAAGEPLTVPQTGTWKGRRYTCTYRFADGSLRVRVNVARNVAAAKASFVEARRSSPGRTTLYGIGEQGFQARDGVIVARKDNFVLTVDPTALPARLNQDSIAWSTTRAVFDCW